MGDRRCDHIDRLVYAGKLGAWVGRLAVFSRGCVRNVVNILDTSIVRAKAEQDARVENAQRRKNEPLHCHPLGIGAAALWVVLSRAGSS